MDNSFLHLQRYNASLFRKSITGFTLLEVLVVVALVIVLGSSVAAVSLDFYRQNNFITSKQNIVIALIRSRSKALSNSNQSPYGVHVGNQQLVEFNGAVFNASDGANFITPMEGAIDVNSSGDIIFSPLSGDALAGSIFLNDHIHAATITVNQAGTILW